jgi:hypothetical protein
MAFDGMPILEQDIERKIDLDHEVKASGFLKDVLGENAGEVLNQVDD